MAKDHVQPGRLDGGLVLQSVPYDHPDAVALTEAAQGFYVSLYGGPDETPFTPAEFTPPHGAFLVGYLDDEPVVMGGWRFIAARISGAVRPAEIKRMFVREDRRGLGLARQMLAALEADAAAAGADWMVLETGRPQVAAVGLYRSSGYADVERFGYYAGEPDALNLGRPLPKPTSERAHEAHRRGLSTPMRDPAALAGKAPDMANSKKIAFLVAGEGVERAELVEPWTAVADAGHSPVLISPEEGKVQLFEHLDKADTQSVDVTVAEASVDDYDALVLPGGVANPDRLRTDEDAVAFVRDFVASGKPVAAICHAPWTLVEADVVRGKQLTSWPSLKTDIRNAGGEWVDAQVVVEGNLITSRKPDDLPAFNSALLEAVNRGMADAAAVAS